MSDVVLLWFPYDTDEWEDRVRALALTFEGEGILHRLARRTWIEKRPCTIRDNPEDFARILGPKWKKALPILRQHFTPIEGEPGVLRCEWLYEEWLKALKKHESYQIRGGKGGRPRKQDGEQLEAELRPGRPPQRKPQLKPQLKAGLSQSTSEGNSSPPTEERAIPPATDSAPAPGGAAPHVANSSPPTPLAAQRDELEDRESAYRTMLALAVDDWLEANPEVAREIGREERTKLRIPWSAKLDDIPVLKLQQLRACVAERIRRDEHWPHERDWDGVTPFGPSIPAMT